MFQAEIPEILSPNSRVEKVITISVYKESQNRTGTEPNWLNVFEPQFIHSFEYHPGISDQIRNAFSEQKLRIRMKIQNCWQSGRQGWIIITSIAQRRQMNAFREQLNCRELDLPLVMHTWAEQDTLISLKKLPSRKGVAHSFTGSRKWQKNWSRWDGISVLMESWHLKMPRISDRSFSIHRWNVCCLKLILLLSPVPFRGRPNARKGFRWYARGRLLGMEETELAKQTTQNAQESSFILTKNFPNKWSKAQ